MDQQEPKLREGVAPELANSEVARRSMLGTCRNHTGMLSVCLPLALALVYAIFIFRCPSLSSRTEQGLISNCQVKQTLMKECPHWVAG